MGQEASKTKKLWGEAELAILKGSGIDIGCGNDPITPSARCFDVADGDANEITRYVHEQFDYVFSAHCLEHMHDPIKAIKEWWQLVSPGGHLIVIVPDEDLYEQGYWPSIMNEDHKSTFTVSKHKSWSPRSYNMVDLVHVLPFATLLNIQLQDLGYNRRWLNHGCYSHPAAKRGLRLIRRIRYFLGLVGIRSELTGLKNFFRLPVDQTAWQAMAQIQMIIKKDK